LEYKYKKKHNPTTKAHPRLQLTQARTGHFRQSQFGSVFVCLCCMLHVLLLLLLVWLVGVGCWLWLWFMVVIVLLNL
jgi:hypothetical protein